MTSDFDSGVSNPSEPQPFSMVQKQAAPARHVILFIPSLAALLERAKQLKTRDLNHEEQVQIVLNALAVVVPTDVAEAVEEKRGYRDVDPHKILRAT